MTKPKHTPGPWKVYQPNDGVRPAVFVGRERGAPVPPKWFIAFLPEDLSGAQHRLADAHLIAATPELLEHASVLANTLIDRNLWTDEQRGALHGLRAAIKKARGES